MSEHTWEDTIEEVKNSSPVYYRLLVNRNEEPCVVCMQWFDEHDYDQKRFINETQYETEEKAEAALSLYKLKASMPLTNLERLKIAAQLLDEDS